MTDFSLDPTLAGDCLILGDLPLCRVLLLNDSRYPWLVLVPRRAGMAEIIDLDPQDRTRLLDEIVLASEVLKTAAEPDKLNIGALGNKVRQLHVHVMARFASDPAWPGPVWGHSPAVPYPAHVAGIVIDRLRALLTPHGLKAIAP